VIHPDDPRLTAFLGRALEHLGPKWPRLSAPINALDNTTLAKAQSAATKDGQVAELTELPEYLALTVDAARSCA
jgi:hypothetical protein